MFSLLGTIKVDKRSRLMNESLDDRVLLKSGSTSLTSFNADPSIDLGGQPRAGGHFRKKEKNTGHALAAVAARQHIEIRTTAVKRVKPRTCLSIGMK